ncbi:MAG: hypothetical protein AAGJ73_05330 [Pseudomonadota bacterium]
MKKLIFALVLPFLVAQSAAAVAATYTLQQIDAAPASPSSFGFSSVTLNDIGFVSYATPFQRDPNNPTAARRTFLILTDLSGNKQILDSMETFSYAGGPQLNNANEVAIGVRDAGVLLFKDGNRETTIEPSRVRDSTDFRGFNLTESGDIIAVYGSSNFDIPESIELFRDGEQTTLLSEDINGPFEPSSAIVSANGDIAFFSRTGNGSTNPLRVFSGNANDGFAEIALLEQPQFLGQSDNGNLLIAFDGGGGPDRTILALTASGEEILRFPEARGARGYAINDDGQVSYTRLDTSTTPLAGELVINSANGSDVLRFPIETDVDGNLIDPRIASLLNNQGDAALLTQLTTVSGATQETFLSLSVVMGGIFTEILRTGDTLTGKVVASILLGSDGFNDVGQLAFQVVFEDTSRAIFLASPDGVSEVPIPAALSIFVGGVGALRLSTKNRRARGAQRFFTKSAS